MNPFGSYRALLGNAIAAVGAAVEIYNKPRMPYREECFAILLVNGWELLLKAMLSKHRKRIFYKKVRGQPYRTLSIADAVKKAEKTFPVGYDYAGTKANLELMVDYRDSAIHFYNKAGFGSLVYALGQTAIVNFRDLVQDKFKRDIAEELTVSLLPLSIAPPVDPIEFLRSDGGTAGRSSKRVREFTAKVKELVANLEADGNDTSRLLTTFTVHLVSTKKVASANLVVGVQSGSGTDRIVIERRTDPNVSHPYREVDVVGRTRHPSVVGLSVTVAGRAIGQYEFRALVYAYDAKSKPVYCWRDGTGAVTRYSPAFIEFIKRLSEEDLDAALRAYRER